MNIVLSLRMQTRITPQLVMSGQLLRAPIQALEQIVIEALHENPALESIRQTAPIADAPARSFEAPAGYSAAVDWEEQHIHLAAKQTVEEYLQDQLALLVDPAELETAMALVYELDGYGYLREPREALASRLGVDQQRLERLITALHQLEPPGIGARDLRECLLIQCRHLMEREQPEAICRLAQRLLEEAWDEFTQQQFNRAARKLGVEPQQVTRAATFIASSLYPYPLNLLHQCSSTNTTLARRPDLIIRRLPTAQQAPVFLVEIPGETAWALRLSASFSTALQANQAKATQLSPDEREWVNEKVQRARSFITAMEQRWVTLRRIAEFVAAYQSDFLEQGPHHLRPLTRAAVAEALGCHESTVSRAVSEKTLQLPSGRLLPLSDLFDTAMPVKEAIRQMMARTAKPLSDREIAEHLQAQGIDVARRTVAKYRGQLNIANLRDYSTA